MASVAPGDGGGDGVVVLMAAEGDVRVTECLSPDEARHVALSLYGAAYLVEQPERTDWP